MKYKFAAIAMGFALATSAHAEGLYAGASYAQAKVDMSGFGDVKPSVLFAKIGTEINKNFAIEGRIGTGVSDDTVSVMGAPVKVEVDQYYGIYAKGILPVGDSVSIYGLIGETHAKITASALGTSVSDSQNSGSYGVGLDFAVAKDVSLNLEWARLFKDTDALSVGVTFKF